MPLESVPAMMRRAREGGYAVGYFESWNVESLYGVIEAAERARAPVIIGFNGEFRSRAERTEVERAYDAKGLLKAAIRDDNPVMIFEHKLLYGSKGARAEPGALDATSDIPDGDYVVPLGKASVIRFGSDVSLFGWLMAAHLARRAADALVSGGIVAEAIDVRAFAPLDWATLVASARKTGRVVIVEEGPKSGGVGAEIAAGLCERLAGVGVARVASADVPVPFSPPLENAYRPDAARIVAAARALCRSSRT
jgi:pyruvate/2-oxoglutarate/acetoin dehydrogenase E1 component